MSPSEITQALLAPGSAQTLLLILAALNIPLFLLWQINDSPNLRKIFHPSCPKNHLPQYTCRLETNLLTHTIRGGTTAHWRLLYTTFTSLFSHREPKHFLKMQIGLLNLAFWDFMHVFPALNAFWLIFLAWKTVAVSTGLLGLSRRFRDFQFQGMQEIMVCWLFFVAASGCEGAPWSLMAFRLVMVVIGALNWVGGNIGGTPINGRGWTREEVECWIRGLAMLVGAMYGVAVVVGGRVVGNPMMAVNVVGGLVVQFARGAR